MACCLQLFGTAFSWRAEATRVAYRKEAAAIDSHLGSRDGGRRNGSTELRDAFDHVAYGAKGAERFVGNFDVESLFDFEGDVDLVEGVNVEFVEGAGQGDGVRRNAL
jgi:hypothetical protein